METLYKVQTTLKLRQINMQNKYSFRLEVVRLAKKYDISKSARLCGVSRPTVYKWLKRYDKDRLRGLSDRSRCPHNSPNRINSNLEAKIIRLRKRWPVLSPYRMRQEFKIQVNEKTYLTSLFFLLLFQGHSIVLEDIQYFH